MKVVVRLGVAFGYSLGCALAVAAVAGAATPEAGWAVKTFAAPTRFSTLHDGFCSKQPESEGCDAYVVTVTNVGSEPSNGYPEIRDRLPAGIEGATNTQVTEDEEEREPDGQRNTFGCQAGVELVTCTYEGVVPPDGVITFRINVRATVQAPAVVTNRVEVEGGGAPTAVAFATNEVNGSPALFGIPEFGVGVFGLDGTGESQAGAHPGADITTVGWSTYFHEGAGTGPGDYDLFVQEPRTEIVNLPAGFVGDARALEQCPLSAVTETEKPSHRVKCPADSLVGFVVVEAGGGRANLDPLYNIPPETGYPAEFAFEYVGTTVTLLPRLMPSSVGYVLSISLPYLPRVEGIRLTSATAMLFGNPTEHNGSGSGEAFLTNPSDCSAAPVNARIESDSWVDPGDWQSAEAPMFAASASHAVSGCGALGFHPSIDVAPETTQVDTPSGYEVDVKVPQEPNMPGDLATPDLKDAVVTLPAGVSVSPSAANGLAACQESGPEGIELGDRDRPASEDKVEEGEEEGPDGLAHPAPGHCPAASQIGEVEVITPLLAEPLHGHVFVAAPQCGGAGQPQCTPHSAEDGELFAIYLEVAGSGIVVKLKGVASVNPETGQVTTRFTETPQFPFSEVKLKLNGGPRASLANSQTCGQATVTSELTPWSTPYTPTATPGANFAIGGCTGGFNPAFVAGTTTPTAGAFSPFTLMFSRGDGEQDLSGLTVDMPEGLVGRIAGIGECGEAEVKAAEANTGGCPASSRVGTATAAAGAGADPFYQSGPVYLTGPYNGAPFGLAVVVAANAGPFHLGNIVVRAAIHINPVTAAVTVVSNPLPQMIDGVPLRVQKVNVTVGGEAPFTFNPTSCVEQAITATISSVQETKADVSSPFGVQGCTAMPFKPVFTASTRGAASKADGASLDVRIATHQGPGVKAGEEEANIHKVDVQLPIQLPSRLSTLQLACTEHQFAVDPAGCPPGAFVGTAVAHTPVLSGPVEGPAILVSHGGAAFPDLVIVLQGQGVVVELTGETDIKKGITYSKFESAPDVPVESFELRLPEGPDSILGSYLPNGSYDFCGATKTVTVSKKVTRRVRGHARKVTVKVKKAVSQALTMPTTITAQNGAVMTQNTAISVTGCPVAKAAKKASVAKKTAKSSRRGK